jgi:DNA polymerase
MVGEYGFLMVDLKKETIAKELAENKSLMPDARRLLELRRDSSMSSLTKYERALERVGPDGRMRYTLQFSGASRTGRWAGRGFQPHNMPRPKTKADHVENVIIPAILDGTLPQKVDDVNQACSDALRGTIIAAPGHEFLVGDWSNIEGVCSAWEAGAEWKLDVFRENYFGDGPDVYVSSYSETFGVPVEDVDSEGRQTGKVLELAFTYGGGVGACVSATETCGADLDKLAEATTKLASDAARNKAEKNWQRAFMRGEDFGLEAAVYIGCDIAKQMWRAKNSEIVDAWWALERAIKWAIERPGSLHHVARCKIWRTPSWLIIELPSGRRLLYAEPRVGKTVEYDEDTGKVRERTEISYMNASAKQWRRERSYAGKFFENVTQAIANDILRAAMLRADKEGYPLVLHVHDEMVAETPTGLYDLKDFLTLMEELLKWAPDLPLKAAGYCGQRFKKD